MYTSFDRALDKIERQLYKYKEKHNNKTHNSEMAALKRGDNLPQLESDLDEEESFSPFITEPASSGETATDELGLAETER